MLQAKGTQQGELEHLIKTLTNKGLPDVQINPVYIPCRYAKEEHAPHDDDYLEMLNEKRRTALKDRDFRRAEYFERRIRFEESLPLAYEDVRAQFHKGCTRKAQPADWGEWLDSVKGNRSGKLYHLEQPEIYITDPTQLKFPSDTMMGARSIDFLLDRQWDANKYAHRFTSKRSHNILHGWENNGTRPVIISS